MSYEMKDGQFSLFKNEYKEPGDNRPSMRGKGMWRGELIEFAVWTKAKEGGEKFFSGKMQVPQQKAAKPAPVEAMDDEIPF